MESIYRDARPSKILEGTNEINRIVLVQMLLKRIYKGNMRLLYDMFTTACNLKHDLMYNDKYKETPEFKNVLDHEKYQIEKLREACMLMLRIATEKNGENGVLKEQEILIFISEMLIPTYLADSAILRTEKLIK